jgi:hypothetical protein
MYSCKHAKKILILLTAGAMFMAYSCSSASPVPSSTATRIDFSVTPEFSESEFHEGTGSTSLSFPLSYLPAMFSLTTMGGTNSVIKTASNRDYESIVILNTKSMRENHVGISSIVVEKGSISVSIEASEDWRLMILPLSESNFLAVPGKVKGTSDYLFILEGSEPNYLRLTYEQEHQAITIRIFNGQDIDTLVATMMPYDEWSPIPNDTNAIQVVGSGSWVLEIVQSADTID